MPILRGNVGLLFRHALNDAWQCSTEIHEAEILGASSFLPRHHHWFSQQSTKKLLHLDPKAVHLIYMAFYPPNSQVTLW